MKEVESVKDPWENEVKKRDIVVIIVDKNSKDFGREENSGMVRLELGIVDAVFESGKIRVLSVNEKLHQTYIRVVNRFIKYNDAELVDKLQFMYDIAI